MKIWTVFALFALVLLSTVDVRANYVTLDDPSGRCNVYQRVTIFAERDIEDGNFLHITDVLGFDERTRLPFDSRINDFVGSPSFDPSDGFKFGAFFNDFGDRFISLDAGFCPRPGPDGFPPSDCIRFSRLDPGGAPVPGEARITEIDPSGLLLLVSPVGLQPRSAIQVIFDNGFAVVFQIDACDPPTLREPETLIFEPEFPQ